PLTVMSVRPVGVVGLFRLMVSSPARELIVNVDLFEKVIGSRLFTDTVPAGTDRAPVICGTLVSAKAPWNSIVQDGLAPPTRKLPAPRTGTRAAVTAATVALKAILPVGTPLNVSVNVPDDVPGGSVTCWISFTLNTLLPSCTVPTETGI